MIHGIELELKKSVSIPDFHYIDLHQNININVYAYMHFCVHIYTFICIWGCADIYHLALSTNKA